MAVKVLDGVFMGDADASFDPDFLDMNKISNLVNLSGRETANAYASHGLVYLSYMWEDNEFFSLFDPRETGVYSSGKDVSIRCPTPFHEISEFIDTSLRYGISVLLFSQDGGGRTAAAMCAYLMLKYRWSYNKALELIMSKKPNAMPNKGFLNQLESLDKYLLKERGHLKERHLNTEDLTHPKVEGNGAIVYDMIADFPPMAYSRWNNFKLDYLEAQKVALEAREANEEKKASKKTRMEAKEDAEDEEYDHQSPAMRECENETVVVVSHVNTKRIQPAPSEVMALDKPRSKGKRLKFKERLLVQLGPDTSENASLTALRNDRGRGRVGKTTPFGDRTDRGSSGSSAGGGMSINGTGLGSGPGSRGPLDGGDSMDMSSIDGSDSTIRSCMRGSRKSGRKNALDVASLLPHQPVDSRAAREDGSPGAGARAGHSVGAGTTRLNPSGGAAGGEGRRGRRGESSSTSPSLSGNAAAAAMVSTGDLYGFVGMDSDSTSTYGNNGRGSFSSSDIHSPSRSADQKHRALSSTGMAINSPGRQVEQELAKVSALLTESDRRIQESKAGGSADEPGGGRRRLLNRKGHGGSGSGSRAEDKRSASAETEAKGHRASSDGDNYGDDFEPQDKADAKDSGSVDSGAKLSLHDLAHRPMYDAGSNMHMNASPSSLSPSAREQGRKRQEEARGDWQGGTGTGTGGRGNEAKYSLEMLAAGGPGGFAHTVSSTAGRPARHHAAKSGAASGAPASHDRTRDLSTSVHGRGEFRNVVAERAVGMSDDDRGVARDKIHRHAPPSSAAVHGIVVDDPLAAFDPHGGDFLGAGGSPLRSSREQIIPQRYPLDRTRPSSAAIANSDAMASTRVGRPSSGRRPLSGAAETDSGPYRSPYSGTARPGSAAIQRPGSAKANAARASALASARDTGPREIGTFGTSARPGSAKAPNSSTKSAGSSHGGGYASVYLKGTAKGSSGKGTISAGLAGGSAGVGKRQGSVTSLGDSSQISASSARGGSGKGSRKLVRRGA